MSADGAKLGEPYRFDDVYCELSPLTDPITLVSKDNVCFCVESATLRNHSAIFQAMLSDSSSLRDGSVPIDEDQSDIRLLMDILHQGQLGHVPATFLLIDGADFPKVRQALRLCDKYGVDSQRHHVLTTLW